MAWIILPQVIVHKRRVHARWRNTVAANIVLDVVLGNGIGHGNDGTLGHGVRKAVSKRRGAGDRSHVENHASTVRFHVADALMDAVVHAFYIDAKEADEIFLRGGLHGPNMKKPRGRQQNKDQPD